MTNHEKLRDLIIDTFLLEPSEYSLELRRENVDTWDSLGIVSMAVGVHETFGYHFTPDEATGIESVADIVRILESKGISFAEG
ncbi:MAG TPA: acyl carrier protein [Planctomycetes bacterium]|nr:acyl carrier protein [Planctomycetota bacterium]